MTLDCEQTFCFGPDVVVRANKMPVMTMSVASDQSQCILILFPVWIHLSLIDMAVYQLYSLLCRAGLTAKIEKFCSY